MTVIYTHSHKQQVCDVGGRESEVTVKYGGAVIDKSLFYCLNPSVEFKSEPIMWPFLFAVAAHVGLWL